MGDKGFIERMFGGGVTPTRNLNYNYCHTKVRRYMRTGRPTDDPKEYRLNVRVNEETYNILEMIAQKKGETVSEVIRDTLKTLNFDQIGH